MKKSFALATAIAMGTAIPVHAQSAGDVVFNLGWFHLAPQDGSRPLTAHIRGNALEVEGSGATVHDSDTAGIALAYFLTDHIAVEGVLGVPPKMKLDGTGTLAQFGRIGTAREWSPSLLLKYWFARPDARLRPYLGAGVSYIWYSDIKLAPDVASGALFPIHELAGPTHAELGKTFAPVFNAGLSYKLSKHWSLGASVSYLVFSTNATLTTRASLPAFGTITSQTRLRVNPIVTYVSVGYTF